MSDLNEIFKGYIITNRKVPKRSYVNPENQYTLEEVQSHKHYGGVLAQDAILVDLDDAEEGELLLRIIMEKNVQCRVHRTDGGYHVFFRGHHMSSTRTKKANALGLITDYKMGTKNGIAILKLDGVVRECVYDTPEIQELPAWLYPIASLPPEFLKLGNGDGRNDALYQYILTLQGAGLTKEESRETIRIINQYILKEPLPNHELETILRDEAFPSESFYDNKGKLKVRQFEEHFCREVNAIKLEGNLHIYSDGMYTNGDSMIRGKMLEYLPDLTLAQRNEILNRSKDRIQSESKRAPAYLISFRNGVYNMLSGDLQEHDPSNIITNRVDWNYNPNAYYDVTDRTLDKLACGDPTIRALLEEIIGYCFYRRNELGKAFILLGDNSNGKSTYLDVVRYILGQYNTSSLALQELNVRFKTAELFNKLANIGDDIPDLWVPDPSVFKKVVTGDRLSAEFKGTNSFEFNPYAKMLLSANEMPRIDDKTGAVKRRLVPVPFKAVFSPSDPDFDPHIKDKLKCEASIEYLVRLGVEGLTRVLANNRFTTNEDIEKELKSIDELNNPLIGYLDEVGIERVINQSTRGVYDHYRSYCIESGMNPVALNSFVRQVNARLKTTTVRRTIKGEPVKIFVPK